MHCAWSEQRDTANEVADAVRLALEKDWLLSSDQIEVRAEEARIVLAGTVPTDEQKTLAEKDAWCVPGVRAIDNQMMIP